MTTLYSLRTLTPDHHTIAKFDDDFNVTAVYNLHPKGHDFTCDCPANSRSVVLRPCKHRRMLPLLLAKADPNAFLDFETGKWYQPLGDLLRPEAGDLAGREALSEVTSVLEQLANMESLLVDEAVRAGTKIHERIEATMEEPWIEPVLSGAKLIGTVGEALGSSTSPVFNPTAGIPKTSYASKDSPNFDNATWFSTVQPPAPAPANPTPIIRRR